jgi:hypothetical protein
MFYPELRLLALSVQCRSLTESVLSELATSLVLIWQSLSMFWFGWMVPTIAVTKHTSTSSPFTPPHHTLPSPWSKRFLLLPTPSLARDLCEYESTSRELRPYKTPVAENNPRRMFPFFPPSFLPPPFLELTGLLEIIHQPRNHRASPSANTHIPPFTPFLYLLHLSPFSLTLTHAHSPPRVGCDVYTGIYSFSPHRGYCTLCTTGVLGSVQYGVCQLAAE